MPQGKKGGKSSTKKGGKSTSAKKPTKGSAKKSAKAPPPRNRVIVPDTSVIVDGRITRMIQEGDLENARILVPLAVVSELEYQANRGRESGFNGLDEIVKIQDLRDAANLELEFVGERPLPEEIELAKSGELDAMIRDAALDAGATLYTSDRVQAHVARAMDLDVVYMRPALETEEAPREIHDLELMRYFTDDTMSVHLKFGVAPLAKRGTPGDLKLVKLDDERMELAELTSMRREIIEAAARDAESFVEIERNGATVVQLRNMRIAIAQPPFSDGLEITAVRPVVKKTLDEYTLPDALRERLVSYQRGIFVSGPPGSGKSTFVTAIAEWLKDRNTIVKTMESPRDLQVSDEITQYAPLERDMELTSDVLLLVRPDFVVYDEVRKTRDFEIFGDMRLAGVGLIGVTHANRAIDAVQRLIGRVELGMIPQVVDTVIHIEKGAIQQVMELTFTVKVPHGMMEADLARPVIEVKDFKSKRTEFEIYTYGEQVVVMPVSARGPAAATKKDRLATRALRDEFSAYLEGRFDVEFRDESAVTLFAEEWEIPRIIGKGGRGIQSIEAELGVKIDVRPLAERGGGGGGAPRPRGRDRDRGARRAPRDEPEDGDGGEVEAAIGGAERYATLIPELRRSKKTIVLALKRELAGQEVDVVVEDENVLTATVGSKGEIRVNRRSEEGQIIADALARGAPVTVRV